MEAGGFFAFAKKSAIFIGHKQIVLWFHILLARLQKALGCVRILPQRREQYLYFSPLGT